MVVFINDIYDRDGTICCACMIFNLCVRSITVNFLEPCVCLDYTYFMNASGDNFAIYEVVHYEINL